MRLDLSSAVRTAADMILAWPTIMVLQSVLLFQEHQADRLQKYISIYLKLQRDSDRRSDERFPAFETKMTFLYIIGTEKLLNVEV